MKRCFPTCDHIKPPKDLGDYHVMRQQQLLLIEYKDNLMSSKAKNTGDEKVFYEDFNKKIQQNEREKPKGINHWRMV